MSIQPDFKHCEACTNRWKGKPPCVLMRIDKSHEIYDLYPSGKIGADEILPICPFICSWDQVRHAAQRLPERQHIDDDRTKRALKRIRNYLEDKQAGKTNQSPTLCGFIAGTPAPGGNYRHVYVDERKRTYVFLRKRSNEEFQAFWDWYQANGLLTSVALMGPQNRFELMIKRACSAKYLKPEMAARLKEFTDPTSLALMAGVLVILAASPAKFVKFVQRAVYGFGLLAELNDFIGLLCRFIECGVYGTTQQHIHEGAESFAKFISKVAATLGFDLVIAFLGKLKLDKAKWKDAANKGDEIHGVPLAAGKMAELAKRGGIHRWHLQSWCKWAMDNESLVVLRKGNPASLPRHFDELTTGKPCTIDWKTAKSGPNAGLVVVPTAAEIKAQRLREKGKNITLEEAQEEIDKVMQALRQTKVDGHSVYRFNPPDGGPGALVLQNGRAICADIDKQGIYVIKDGRGQPHPDFAKGDNLAVQERMQREVYGNPDSSPVMDNHGCQDFYLKWDEKEGRWVQGRTPTDDEEFIAIYPDGHVAIIKSPGDLKRVYAAFGIPWPY